MPMKQPSTKVWNPYNGSISDVAYELARQVRAEPLLLDIQRQIKYLKALRNVRRTAYGMVKHKMYDVCCSDCKARARYENGLCEDCEVLYELMEICRDLKR